MKKMLHWNNGKEALKKERARAVPGEQRYRQQTLI